MSRRSFGEGGSAEAIHLFSLPRVMTSATTLEIDLNAIAANWRTLDAMHPASAAGVVKADAYGLGAQQVAAKLFAAGCRHFFIAHLPEALAIRHFVPGAMLAVLHGILPGEEQEFSAHNIIPVLTSINDTALWRAEAKRLKKKLPAILHFDTGMNRLAFSAADATQLANDPALLEGVDVTHIMSHLISSELPEDPLNAQQKTRFESVRALFPGIVKASLVNSSGIFLNKDFAYNLTRPGAALYGLNPTPYAPNPMRPVVRLTARILRINHLNPGDTAGYNAIWAAQRPSKIATVAVGYADGFLRSLSNTGFARFDGKRIPLVGRVSMDLSTFDVTDVPNIAPGDSLELIGPGHDADALAIEAGTNGYEILTSLGRRYTRQYLGTALNP